MEYWKSCFGELRNLSNNKSTERGGKYTEVIEIGKLIFSLI